MTEGPLIVVMLGPGCIEVSAEGNHQKVSMQTYWLWPDDGGRMISVRDALDEANEYAKSIGAALGVNVRLLKDSSQEEKKATD
jgi:hypothetical protein